jgi:hypothetical protein
MTSMEKPLAGTDTLARILDMVEDAPRAADPQATLTRDKRHPRLRKAPIPRDERHFLVVPGLHLVYARVPKAANSTIRYRLAADLGLRGQGRRPSNDAFWLDQPADIARCLTRLQFARLPRDARPWCFTVVRHPVARLWSAWNNKVQENAAVSARFRAMGVDNGQGFDAFVARVAATPDAACDIHVRSQWAILALRDRLLPDHVARVESLAADWETIRARVLADGGPRLGDLEARNVRLGTTPDVSEKIAPDTLDLIRTRYAADFAAFYPDG